MSGSGQQRNHSFWRSLGWALAGVARTARREPNFRRELAVAVAALALAAWLRAPLTPIIIMCALVLALELVNSAVEATVDLVSPERHELAAVAKDASAGAVLVASVAAVLVGLLVMGPPLWQRLFG